MIGSSTPQAPYADYTLNDTVFADGAGTLATISAAGGVHLRGNITFNVVAANAEMDISAVLGDEIGTTGGLTKTARAFWSCRAATHTQAPRQLTPVRCEY